MSVTEDLFLRVHLPPVEAARELATTLDWEIEIRDGTAFLGRDGVGDVAGWVAGKVHANVYSDEPPDPQERTVFDGHPVVWEIFRRGPELELQRRAARAVFDAVVERLRWPAVLTHDLQTAVAAWDPDHGLREFPDGTPVDAPHLTTEP